MKPILNSITAILFTLAIFISGCEKDNGYTNAILTGYDSRTCACCGGVMINFENNSNPFSGTSYDLTNTDSSLGINSSTAFPVYMKVKWEHNQTRCVNLITVTSIERQ